MANTVLMVGRRRAEFSGKHIKLFLLENKRRGFRPVRGGDQMLGSELSCWAAAIMWTKRGKIDFGDRVL